MNTLTAIFLLIFILASIVISTNCLVLTCRWAPMRKGRKPKQSFIKSSNRIILWVSLIIAYLAMVLYCVFYDADLTTKAKHFALFFILVSLNPVVIFSVYVHCFLFHEDRKFRGTGDGSLSHDEIPN